MCYLKNSTESGCRTFEILLNSIEFTKKLLISSRRKKVCKKKIEKVYEKKPDNGIERNQMGLGDKLHIETKKNSLSGNRTINT